MQRTTYHNYEIDKRELPFELAITLAQFYNVSTDYIAGLTNDPTLRFKKKSEQLPLAKVIVLIFSKFPS